MLGQRPMPSKAARKRVVPVHTFHAHKIILAAGSRVYSQIISALTLRYDRLLLQSKVSLPWLAVADLLHDENTDNVCRVDLENIYGEYEPSTKINVAILCYLYG
jgi:hypothetical protein